MRTFLTLLLIFLTCSCLRGQDSLFTAAEKPSTVTDDNPVTVGMVFNSKLDGVITYFRIYKGIAADTTTYTFGIWLANGIQIYTQRYKISGAVGWKRVQLTFPFPITANTSLVAGVFLPRGDYGSRLNVYSSDRVRGNLVAPASSKVGGNGRYVYGSALAFPGSTYQAGSYYLDVVFQPVQTQTLIVNAGRDTTYALPRDTVRLNGIVTGDAPTFDWTMVDSLSWSWDTTGTIVMKESTTLTPYMTGMTEGRYVFRLTGRDAVGNVSSNDVTITIVADPKGVLIELLRDGTWRVVDEKKLFLLKTTGQ
jgi:Domain of unknown function (DUF4082)/K319L-like, PKD domain